MSKNLEKSLCWAVRLIFKHIDQNVVVGYLIKGISFNSARFKQNLYTIYYKQGTCIDFEWDRKMNAALFLCSRSL